MRRGAMHQLALQFFAMSRLTVFRSGHVVSSGCWPGNRPVRWFESQATRRWQQGAVVLDHTHQGADFISVLLSSSCEFFRLAISLSV